MDISPSIDSTIGNYWSQWLAAHPLLALAIERPLMGIAILCLAIVLLWGLFKALGRGIEQIWIFLLTSPFKLLQPIFRPIWIAIGARFGRDRVSDDRGSIDADAERIALILARLHGLHQEQDTLLQELSQLTDSRRSIDRDGDIIVDK